MKRQSLSDLADASNKKMRTDVDKTTMPFSPIISDPELALRQFSTLLGSCSVQNLSRTNYTGLSCLLEYLADDDRDLHTGAFCSFPSLSMSTTNPLGSFSFIKEEQNSAKDFEISSSAPALSPPNGSIAQESLQSKLERSATLKLSRPLCANRPTISEVPATVVKNIRESLLSVIESRLRRCIILLKKTKIDTKRNSLRAKCLYNIWKALKMPTIVTSFVAVNASATDPAPKKVIQSSLDSRSTVSVPVTFLTVADIAFGEQHIVTVEIIAPGTISGKLLPTKTIILKSEFLVLRIFKCCIFCLQQVSTSKVFVSARSMSILIQQCFSSI
mmetsp:Transcript_40953/g.96124  ORF Transcript_40953/g.96124 Transcript_40953/m.96124 type:complete len:330 (-) Transcript_40953:832-1821(-)